MKVAVTADVHLSTGDAHPERYRALEDVFRRTDKAGIEHLIIAGDLFNEDSHNYSEFESICRDHPAVAVHIIPGNHDPDISKKSITEANVHIYTEPEILELDSLTFLFVPYEKNAKMGEKIAQLEDAIDGKEWVLVGHGDYYGGVKELNPLEPGTYMPLSRKDLGRFKPRTVFLGHIHKPHSPHDHVHYVGSPCGLDISETGYRRFLVYDTTNGNIEDRAIETDVLYFTEAFLVLPREDEVPLLKQEIAKRIESWNIDASDHPKVQVRVEASGYAKDRSAVREVLKRGFEGFAYYKDQLPTIDNLSVSSDDQLEAISERTMKLIEKLDWSFGGDEPTREEVELAALSVIYEN
jgi:DNA repair exonuclease SbcCD nuclease subunit